MISKMKGNISNNWEGEFISDNKKVKLNLTFSSLKNSNSLNKFNIKTRLSITKVTKKNDLKKIKVINFI